MDTYYHKTPNKISKFFGQYRWLSNFYPAEIEIDGVKWPTSEHYYQSQKSKDSGYRSRIRRCLTPKDAKHLGSKITLRSDWDDAKDDIMYRAVRAKFTQHPILKERLIETGDAYLVEGNNWNDEYWGECRGKGQNKLGHILMKIRKELALDE